MVKVVQKENNKIYQCEECGFHYAGKDLAQLKKNPQLTRKMIDALLVDFINVIGGSQCLDYGLYTKDLKSADRA